MTVDAQIERVTLPRARFQAWLHHWNDLRIAGWNVTVLIANDNSHAIGIAWRDVDAIPTMNGDGHAQMSLLG